MVFIQLLLIGPPGTYLYLILIKVKMRKKGWTNKLTNKNDKNFEIIYDSIVWKKESEILIITFKGSYSLGKKEEYYYYF